MISDKEVILDELRKAMLHAAEELKFEKAAKIRDEIIAFEKDLGIAVSCSSLLDESTINCI